MNKYEFYSKLLQEDFPVKYRQDFAEHDSEQCKKIQDLKVQLAEALWHLDGVLNNHPEDMSHRFGGSRSFLARHAQGAQSVDAQKEISELIGFEFKPDELQTVNGDELLRVFWRGAALATQPAACEPIGWLRLEPDDNETASYHFYRQPVEGSSPVCFVTAPVAAGEPVATVLSSRLGNDTSTIDKALPDGTKLFAAPPAAAHGDEKS